MKKSSIIFKMICLAIATVLCISALPAMAEDAEETVVVEENVENVTEAIEDEAEEPVENTEEVTTESTEDVTEEVTEEVTEDTTQAPSENETEEPSDEVTEEPSTEAEEDEEIEEEEYIDLFAATLRDGGTYVTPGEDNATPFTYNGVRYKVEAGMGNSIKLDGFENYPTIETEPIIETAKNRLQANGVISTSAAHSGYVGLAVSAGDVVYRTGVTGGKVYVFSAWVKMPGGTIKDDDRAFKVIGEGDNGGEYIVGWNEIGRDIEATGAWQQILFTFKAPENGLFQIDFKYRGSSILSIDDLELYEAELFENPLEIRSIVTTDAEGNEYKKNFTTAGVHTHKTVLYNNDEDDVFFIAVMALYKNDILMRTEFLPECALVHDETEVEFEIEIPEDEDISQYKYMVYFISDASLTKYYGDIAGMVSVAQGK